MGIQERKAREKEARRRQIQEASRALFEDKGFNATTMSDIAKKVELSPATIYLYYESKEELFLSLNIDSLQFLLDQILKIHSSNKSIEEKMLSVKEAMYKTAQFDPMILRNLFHGLYLEKPTTALSDPLLQKLDQLTVKTMTLVINIYEEGVLQGIFKEGPSKVLMDILWGGFAGLILWSEAKKRINDKVDYLKSSLDLAFELFMKGIRKQKDSV